MLYVFLNPDGTQHDAMYVLVESSTGVEYAHQCAGTATWTRVAEGFLIPVGDSTNALALTNWFWKSFKGASYRPAPDWGESRIAELRQLVEQIPCWRTQCDEGRDERRDERLFLKLDEMRLTECTEGWVPVESPYGRAILIFDNCD